MNKLLVDKKVFITGASKGLGKAISLELAKQGAVVGFSFQSDINSATKCLDELKEVSNKDHFYLKLDCSNFSETMTLQSEIQQQWGDLDVLINNAGKSEFLPAALMDENDWDKILDLNLKGTFASTKSILPFFIRKKRGMVLNMGSLAGARILAAPISYCASKAGVKGLTESMAKELGRYNIQINCLAPGILEGGVARGIPENKLKDYLDQVALKRVGNFEEVAKFAAFLISDKNSYMTGQTIIMEGGL